MPIYKTDKKKDGLAQYRVRVNYTDRNGEAHSLTRIAYGLAEAKLLEAELMKKYSDGQTQTVSNSMTIGQLYEEYIKAKEPDVRYSSLVKTKNCLTKGVLPTLQDVKLTKLSNQLLQNWKNGMTGKGFSQTTLRNYYAEFRGMLNYAVKMEYISKNPLVTIGNFKEAFTEKPKDKLHYYTAEQFSTFIAEAKRKASQKGSLKEWSYYVFFAIAFYTGARKGEILALKWSDIDGNIMHIRRSIAQKYGKGDLETPPKNKSSYRVLQIPKPLLDILADQKQRQKQEKNFSEDFRICGGVIPIRDSSLTKKNVEYAEAVGLPHIRIHDFRHTHATLLVNEGINIQEIARRLGHSNVEITWNTYSHLYPREEERAVAILDKII